MSRAAKYGGVYSPMLRARVNDALKRRVTAARGEVSESDWLRAAAEEKLSRDGSKRSESAPESR